MQAEEAVKAARFPCATILQPGMLDRGELARGPEKWALKVMSSVPVSQVGLIWSWVAWECGWLVVQQELGLLLLLLVPFQAPTRSHAVTTHSMHLPLVRRWRTAWWRRRSAGTRPTPLAQPQQQSQRFACSA